MCIPPINEDPRLHFSLLNDLKKIIRELIIGIMITRKHLNLNQLTFVSEVYFLEIDHND